MSLLRNYLADFNEIWYSRCRRITVWRIWFCYKVTTYLLIYSMEQSPSWKANRISANQEIPRILWNPNVHYHIHKCPPPVPILCHLDPVHTPTSYFWRSILILSSHLRLGLPSGLFPSGLLTKTLYTPLLSPINAIFPVHLILLNFITRKILGEEYWSFSSAK